MSETRCVLKGVRFSYAYVWKPRPSDTEGEKPKYGVAIMIPKEGKYADENIAAIKRIIKQLEEAAKEKNKGKLPKEFKVCLRDGDEEADEFPDYKGHFFINANSTTKPIVVSTQKDEKGNFKPITDEEEFYSGCYGNVSVNFFGYATKGKNGIGCALNNIQKTRDGERFGGRTSANEDFADLEEDDDDFGGGTTAAKGADEEEDW